MYVEASVLQSNLGGHCRTKCGKLSEMNFLKKIYKRYLQMSLGYHSSKIAFTDPHFIGTTDQFLQRVYYESRKIK